MKITFTEEELLSSVKYDYPYIVNGKRMHGGVMLYGAYWPPRTLYRYQAIANWTNQLLGKGGELWEVQDVHDGMSISGGTGQDLWNDLTFVSRMEARARLFVHNDFPDLQQWIVEDISNMALGHVHKGLIKAHALDECGSEEEGGHDSLWLAIRDITFKGQEFPDPPHPPRRLSEGVRVPEIDYMAEFCITALVNLLIIEMKTKDDFSRAEQVIAPESLFILKNIATDEDIHISSLRLYFGELSMLTIKTIDGENISGREVIQRIWDAIL